MSNWYYLKSRCRLYNTRNPHRLFEQWWSSNLVDNYINWAAHIYVYESQLNIHYPQVQPFVLPYLDTVHRFAPQTNPLMDAVVAKPTLKLAPIWIWKYHKERPHKENQTSNNTLTLLFSKSYSAFKKYETEQRFWFTCKRFVHIAISPQVISAPKVLQSLRKGRFPTVVKGAR